MERFQKMNVPYTLYQLWSVFSQSCPWGVRWGVNIPFFWRKTCQIKFIIHGHVHPRSIPGQKMNSPKNMLSNITKSCWSSLVVLYSQNYLAGICGHYHESSVCLEYSKKFLPKQINLQNFLTQKTLGIKNFNPRNDSPITPITRNLWYNIIWYRELTQASFSKQDKVQSLWNESSITIIFIIVM